MYGTVYRIRPRPGQEDALLEFARSWQRERRPKVQGFVADIVYRSEKNPGEYLGVVVFESREAWERNANDPAEQPWYERFRSYLQSDPEWEDGDVIFAVGVQAPIE